MEAHRARSSYLMLLMMVFLAFSFIQSVRCGQLKASECPRRCSFRCSATSHQKPCMFFCQKCCKTCLCVPPGTYGNKWSCPCYNNWKTQQGAPKCP